MSEREPIPQPLELTHDVRYAYMGLWTPGGVCRIRIFEAPGRTPVIIASELPENHNTSITNMAEYLAAEIIARHFPARFEEDEPVVWIEHYPSIEVKGRHTKVEYSRVRFASWTPRVETKWLGGHLKRRIKLGEPEWDYLPEHEVEQLVGQPLTQSRSSRQP
jgi:hypothetical protein